jgi:predicted transcriptional regulator
MLMIGERLRAIRESKNLSQGDIEQRTGMLRCYTSRVENGHTVPSRSRSSRRPPRKTSTQAVERAQGSSIGELGRRDSYRG